MESHTHHKLLGPLELINKAWIFYKKHVKKLWPLFFLGTLTMVSYRFNHYSHSAGHTAGIDQTFPVWASVLALTLGLIVYLLLIVSKIALYKSISDLHKGQFVSITDSYKKASDLFWPFVLLSLMVCVATLGAFVPLIIPGILFAGYIMFSRFELIDRNKKGFDAIVASWNLVRGHWWSIVWRVFIIALIVGLCSFGGILIIGTVGALMIKIVGFTTFFSAFWFAITILAMTAFIFIFIAPLAVLSIFELYLNLRTIRAPHEPAHEIVNSQRKNKIILFVVIGAAAIVVSWIIMAFLIGILTGALLY